MFFIQPSEHQKIFEAFILTYYLDDLSSLTSEEGSTLFVYYTSDISGLSGLDVLKCLQVMATSGYAVPVPKSMNTEWLLTSEGIQCLLEYIKGNMEEAVTIVANVRSKKYKEETALTFTHPYDDDELHLEHFLFMYFSFEGNTSIPIELVHYFIQLEIMDIERLLEDLVLMDFVEYDAETRIISIGEATPAKIESTPESASGEFEECMSDMETVMSASEQFPAYIEEVKIEYGYYDKD
jgi:hypothetical protein